MIYYEGLSHIAYEYSEDKSSGYLKRKIPADPKMMIAKEKEVEREDHIRSKIGSINKEKFYCGG